MTHSKEFRELFSSLQMRKRPEDIAQLILKTPEIRLCDSSRTNLELAARGALARNKYGFSSMSDQFFMPVDFEKSLSKGKELFPSVDTEVGLGQLPEHAHEFIELASPKIGSKPYHFDFLGDRLNNEQRRAAELNISKRQYNKRFRYLRRLEKKKKALSVELRKRQFTLISKSRLASFISEENFFSDPLSAAFISYYTARCNLRSEFTAGRQQRPFDEIADQLLKDCQATETTNWLAIAHVYPDSEVLEHLSDEQKGKLLGIWFSLLCEIAELLKKVWLHSNISRETMIVQRGNDSTTWNNTAGAWNKARSSWFNLLFSLGMEDLIEAACPGKVLRLMAADVVAWHAQEGGTLEQDTKVWNAIPSPWEVLSGETVCTRDFVRKICQRYGVDPIQKGWIAPPPTKKVAKFKPTPELVHGVTVAHPGLAKILKSYGVFSGKPIKL